MRGFVTLATAFALPAAFPQRDLAVLTAFAVVFATLVLQGLTLAPLIRIFKLNQEEVSRRELAQARANLADAALTSLGDHTGPEADNLKYGYTIQKEASKELARSHPLKRRRALGLAAISAERSQLEQLRNNDLIGPEAYLLLQEELDWSELTLLCDDERRIQES
jgi:monovalent cation/hydrogen antiporter